jgi:hypothetical protein
MTKPRHMYGSIGAACGALLPAFALLLVVPPLSCASLWCGSLSVAMGGSNQPVWTVRPEIIAVTWSPYLDNGDEGATARGDGRSCRAQAAPPPPPLRLARYEFPATFDPASFPDRALYACVLARSDGTILGARLAQRIHGGAVDRELVATIRDKWHFEAAGGTGTGWERVRLNQGPLVEAVSLIS